MSTVPPDVPGMAASPTEPVPQLPVAPPETRGRAGRNLPAALGVGVVLGVLVIGSLAWRKELFLVLVAAALLVALEELRHALAGAGIRLALLPLGASVIALQVAAYRDGRDAMVVTGAVCLLAVLAWTLPESGEALLRDAAASGFALVYVPFLAGFAALLLAERDGAWRILTFIAVTVASDVGGYAAGVLFGKHRMAPHVSPKKSWEGFAGSLVTCVLVGVGAVTLLLHGSALAGAALGLAAVLSATVGDLGESLVKRDLAIKDMGRLLPGHGGIMDRLDSLLPTAPVAWILLTLLVPVR